MAVVADLFRTLRLLRALGCRDFGKLGKMVGMASFCNTRILEPKKFKKVHELYYV
jgi:hypothetical protein